MSSASAGLVLHRQDNVCAYSISGQYCLLVRVLFIILLVLAIICNKHDWIFNGAMVSTILYSSIAAIHGLLLIGDFIITNSQLDLDIFPAYSIICIAGTATFHLRFNKKSRNIAPREWLVIKVWNGLLQIGSTVIWVTFLFVQTPPPPPGGICSTTAGFMRKGQTMIEIEDSFSDHMEKFENIIMGPWIWCMLCSVTYFIYGMRKSYHHTIESYPVWFLSFNGPEVYAWLPENALFSVPDRLIAVGKWLVTFLCWCALIIYIVAMELVLFQSGMPEGEGFGAVGQWAPAVSSLFVVAGAGFIAGGRHRGSQTEGDPRDLEA